MNGTYVDLNSKIMFILCVSDITIVLNEAEHIRSYYCYRYIVDFLQLLQSIVNLLDGK